MFCFRNFVGFAYGLQINQEALLKQINNEGALFGFLSALSSSRIFLCHEADFWRLEKKGKIGQKSKIPCASSTHLFIYSFLLHFLISLAVRLKVGFQILIVLTPVELSLRSTITFGRRGVSHFWKAAHPYHSFGPASLRSPTTCLPLTLQRTCCLSSPPFAPLHSYSVPYPFITPMLSRNHYC